MRLGNLVVGESLGHQAQHLPLAIRERHARPRPLRGLRERAEQVVGHLGMEDRRSTTCSARLGLILGHLEP